MPKPVFRSSTGALPRSLEETISRSFMPNAETIEIDEDDILSIMNTIYRPDASKFGEHSDGVSSIEADDEAILDIETPAVSNFHEDGHKPIVVTAKQTDENSHASHNDSKSNLVIFVLFVLVTAALVGAYLYNLYQQPTLP